MDGSKQTLQPGRQKRKSILGLLLLSTLFAGCAHTTPPIVDAAGEPIPESIACMEKVPIRDTNQTIVVRGVSKDAPILLWLPGGPLGSELGWTRNYLKEMEQDFLFVNWEQAGAGLSYKEADFATVQVQDYVEDTIALTRYLLKTYDKQKIVLVGHSWGSIVGLMAAQLHPELYYAYIGIGQQVNARENDTIGYEMVLSRAREAGDTKVVKTLEEMGPPPYTVEDGDNYRYLFQRLPHYSPSNSPYPEPDAMKMLFPEEYSLGDTIRSVKGLLAGVRNIYPQLNELDFEKTIPGLNLPVFFFTGRYDFTCVQSITERYFEGLRAPYKELVWFEESGHNLCYQETELFINVFKEKILPLAQN